VSHDGTADATADLICQISTKACGGVLYTWALIEIISSMNHQLFIEVCIEALGLKRGTTVTVVDADQTFDPADEVCEGFCMSSRHRHIIEVVTKGTRSVRSLIAHELVHAYVEENHPRAEWHGRVFIRMASYLESYLDECGYTLDDEIYLEDADQ